MFHKRLLFGMNQSPILRVISAKPFVITMALALFLVLLDAVVSSLDLWGNFAEQGNDDIMRLLSVRDWIAGQGWYDVAQYRALPPEGVSLHWSRYIDLGIAAIIWPLSLIFPMETAELLAASIWPTFIMVINLLVIGFGTRRIFGTHAACFALICTVLWPVTGDLHSGAGNVDHHNVQMLMMTLMALAAVWPSRPVTAGIVGGFAAAFSLAIGLESLPFVVGVGFVVLMRAVLVATPLVQRLLLTFCVALGFSSVILWLGQAAPGTRLNPVCDQLALPTLSVIWVAVVASTLPLALGRSLSGPLAYLIATVVLTAVGIAVAWPLISVCLDGPYATLPPMLQEFIDTRITEAKPGLAYAKSRPDAFVSFVLPVFVTTALGAGLWAANRRRPVQAAVDNAALAGLLVLCLVGVAMIFVQMRTVIMAASVVPIIAGYVLAVQMNAYLETRNAVRALIGLVIAVMIMSPSLVVSGIRPLLPERSGSAREQAADCRTYGSLTTLNEVPPALILNHFNFGPSLLWATHHDVLSVGYHRSAAGMSNSIVPFEMEDAEMAAYVRAAGATHLLLCNGYRYSGAFATALASGGDADWLRRVPLSGEDQVLFEVLP